MAVFSFDQLKKLWTDNGGNPTYAAMAAAIALAESGGNTSSVSKPNKNGSQDWGAWQINNGGEAMLDPNANAKRAIAMSNNGTNWKPWCTAYSDGACGTKGGKYLGGSSPFWKYLTGTGAQAPSANPPASSSGSSPQITDVSAKSDCLISLPSLGPVGGGCLLTTGQGRAIGGTLLIAAGAGVFLLGVILISGKGSTVGGLAMTAIAPEAKATQVAASVAAGAASSPERKKPSDTGVHTVNKEKKLGRVIDAREANNEPLSRSEYLRQQREKHPGSTHVTASGETF